MRLKKYIIEKESKEAFDNPKTGETAYLSKKGKAWYIDAGDFDADRPSRKEAIDQLKKWGYTKKSGIE